MFYNKFSFCICLVFKTEQARYEYKDSNVYNVSMKAFTQDKIWGGAFSGIPPFNILMSEWIEIQSYIGESIRREPKHC